MTTVLHMWSVGNQTTQLHDASCFILHVLQHMFLDTEYMSSTALTAVLMFLLLKMYDITRRAADTVLCYLSNTVLKLDK